MVPSKGLAPTLKGYTCTLEDFTSFFLPKFTEEVFLHVMSPSILTVVGDKAYPAIEKIPNFGFDFKEVPNLLSTVEDAPLLYQLFCDHGCSLKEQTITPHHYLKLSTRPCVLLKVLEEAGDLSNDKEFHAQLFELLDYEQLSTIALAKIGSENVRNLLDHDGNTLLHATLKKSGLELARTIISRYGVNDVNQMNRWNKTILHVACHSMTCLPNMIELLLDMPGIKTDLKDSTGAYAYDILLRTLKEKGCPSSVYSSTLQRLFPEEAVRVDQMMMSQVNKKRCNSNDPDFSGPRKRKSDVVSSYKRCKRKTAEYSMESENV